jgi:3-oxoacyl-[acyl-carrier protein] reductase
MPQHTSLDTDTSHLTMSLQTHLPLRGRTAIITGSSRGIGAGIALELANRGADVVITYTSQRSQSLVSELRSKIESLPHSQKTLSLCTDLRAVTAPSDIIDALKRWSKGPVRVDILVNNAGMELAKSLGEITSEEFAQVYDLNVRAPLLLTQALLPYFPPKSRIINISSVGSRAGFGGLGVYCSSKAALEGLTRCWAAELGKNGTTVNAVNPGPVESEMLDNIPKEIVEGQKQATPIEKRLGTIEEVASVVSWLAGEESRWVTGQTFSASGGWAMY